MSRAPNLTVTRWWWVRHAPVTSHQGRLYGQSDVPANTDDRPTFEALAAALPKNAVWITSHLSRTHQTAAAIADAGHPVPDAAVEPDLAEQHFGEWQGLDYEALERARGEARHRLWVAPAEFAAPGGESFVDVVGRVARCVERLSDHHAGADIVAVAHGGSIRAALGQALGIEPERALGFSVDNLSVTRIDHIHDGEQARWWRVVAVNLPPASVR